MSLTTWSESAALDVAVLEPIVARVRTDKTAVKSAAGVRWTDEGLTPARLRAHLNDGAARGCCPILAGQRTVRLALLDLDALNDERPARSLTPEQLLLVFRLARQKGCHIGIEFMCRNLGYTMPAPIEPEDEAAVLKRQFIEAQRGMQDMLARMERLQRMGASA